MRIRNTREGSYGGAEAGGLQITGGILDVPLSLFREPEAALEVATKNYVDNLTNNLDASSITMGVLRDDMLSAWTGDIVTSIGSRVTSISNSVVPGEYTSVTVNAGGLVKGVGGLIISDIPNLSWNKFINDRPTTLSGYGITDAVNKNGSTLTGHLVLEGNPVNSNDLATKTYVDSLFPLGGETFYPVGSLIKKTTSSTPVGFLKANGSELDKLVYSDLYTVIGDTYTPETVTGNSYKPWKNQYNFNMEVQGNLGTWSKGPDLPNGLYSSHAVVTKNRVYLLGGGDTGQTSTTDVISAPINSSGVIGSWSVVSNLPSAVSYGEIVITSSRVYLIGGIDSSVSSLKCIYTTINSDGTLNTWSEADPLPIEMSRSQAIVTKNRVYLLGSNQSGVVLTAPISSSGVIGTWVTDTSLPVEYYRAQAVVTKNRVYLLGGHARTLYGTWSSTTATYTAPINEDGTLGTWSASNSLNRAMPNSQAIVTNGRVWLLGNDNLANPNTPSNQVISATIDSEGVIGTWSDTGRINTAIGVTQVVTTSTRVYLLGGLSASRIISKVTQFATFAGGLDDYSEYFRLNASGGGDVFMIPDIPPTGDYYTYIKHTM